MSDEEIRPGIATPRQITDAIDMVGKTISGVGGGDGDDRMIIAFTDGTFASFTGAGYYDGRQIDTDDTPPSDFYLLAAGLITKEERNRRHEEQHLRYMRMFPWRTP